MIVYFSYQRWSIKPKSYHKYFTPFENGNGRSKTSVILSKTIHSTEPYHNRWCLQKPFVRTYSELLNGSITRLAFFTSTFTILFIHPALDGKTILNIRIILVLARAHSRDQSLAANSQRNKSQDARWCLLTLITRLPQKISKQLWLNYVHLKHSSVVVCCEKITTTSALAGLFGIHKWTYYSIKWRSAHACMQVLILSCVGEIRTRWLYVFRFNFCKHRI